MLIDELDKEDTFYAKKVLNNKDIHSLLDSLDIYCMYYHSCRISNYNFQSHCRVSDLFLRCSIVYLFLYIMFRTVIYQTFLLQRLILIIWITIGSVWQ